MTFKLFILTLNLLILICTTYANKTGSTIPTISHFNNAPQSNPCPVIEVSEVFIKDDTCGKQLGFIRNIKVTGATSYQWIDTSGKIVGTTPELEHISEGMYKLIALNGTCSVESPIFNIKNHTLNIRKRYDSTIDGQVLDVTIRQPDSGQKNGFIQIHSLYATNGEPVSISWRDGTNKMIATGMLLDMINADTYTVTLETPSGCKNTAATFVLPNWTCALSFDDKQLQITPAPCNKNIGSIKGMVIKNATGTLVYKWVDSLNKTAGTSINLENVAGGKYRLQFIDESRCDTITTPYYNIESPQAIRLDTTNLRIQPSICIKPTGAVSGLTTTGASVYEWKDRSGTIISNELNLSGVFSGAYILRATNTYGCEAVTGQINVPLSTEIADQSLFQLIQQAPRCDSANGSVFVRDFPDAQQYTYRWVDSARKEVTLSQSLELKGIPAASYFLYAKDGKGCEQMITVVRFAPMPAPKIDQTGLQTSNDLCEQGIGFIKGLKITSGTAPFTINWMDQNRQSVSRSLDINQLQKGVYTLQISDQMNCKDSNVYTITNQNQDFQKPQYNSLTIPQNTSATLRVLNYQPGTYLMFDASRPTEVIQENTSGNFTTAPLLEDKLFYVLLKTGVCESAKATVEVKAAGETKFYVPNAFTPNHDGKNEYLRPGVYGVFHSPEFTIYDRWGTPVFRSKDLRHGWDGKFRGHEVPAGVYAWSLSGKDSHGNLIKKHGTVTIIR